MFVRKVAGVMVALCVALPVAIPNISLAQQTQSTSPNISATASRQRLKACFGDKCVRITRSRFLGDFCWNYAFEEGGGQLKLGVFHMGGGHFLLSGKVREGDSDFVLNGNAELIGGELVILLQSVGGGLGVEIPVPGSEETQFVNVVGSATFSGSLDPETLGGEALIFEINTFEEDPQGFETGLGYGGAVSLTQVECF